MVLSSLFENKIEV